MTGLYTITKTIHFCYGHRLLDYEGPCARLHGHNGRLEIDLRSGALDASGMVCDFLRVKEVVRRMIDERLDHKMILHENDPVLSSLKKLGEPYFVLKENPTAENLARMIFGWIREAGFPVSAVRLWESHASCAEFKEG
jgi:6-pyruvoyltetrahydropterin/6-carboxytetrahydropterin synthase